jgi:rare lipoprotein A
MSSLRIVAATAALCLFAHSTTASAKDAHSNSALSQNRKHKISLHQRADKPHHKSHRLAAHRRSHRHAARRRLHHLATRSQRARNAPSGPRDFTGTASYYWEGSSVASGGRFDPNLLTAAHRTLPFGTRLRVTDLISQRSVIVTINDRGPFVQGRVLDLSLGAARVLGMTDRGITRIRASVM